MYLPKYFVAFIAIQISGSSLQASNRRGCNLLEFLTSHGIVGNAPSKALQDRLQNPAAIISTAASNGLALAVSAEAMVPGEVTGDFLKLIQRPDGKLSFFFGDAAGHGERAAVSSLKLHAVLERPDLRPAFEKPTAAGTMQYIDEAFKLDEDDANLTLGHLLMNYKTGEIQFASAGMPYVYVLKTTGKVITLKSAGFWIGYHEEPRYSKLLKPEENVHHQLNPGDTIFMMTDGITESRDIAGDLIGNRIPSILGGLDTKSTPGDMVMKLFSYIHKKIDDHSLMVLRWNPANPRTKRPGN